MTAHFKFSIKLTFTRARPAVRSAYSSGDEKGRPSNASRIPSPTPSRALRLLFRRRSSRALLFLPRALPSVRSAYSSGDEKGRPWNYIQDPFSYPFAGVVPSLSPSELSRGLPLPSVPSPRFRR